MTPTHLRTTAIPPCSPVVLLLVAATLVFGADASAQNYNEHTLRSVLEFVPTAPGTDGHRFTVPVTSTPVGPSLVNDNTAHWFNVPPDNIDWLSGFFPDLAYQYTAFRSADATVRNVFLSAIDSNAQFTTEYSPELIIEHLSLENVNVDPGSIQLRFDGTDFSWTMSNSRYATAIATPLFRSGVPLALRSVAGTSALAFWNGEIGSPTKLVVDPGTTLVLERVGQISLPQSLAAQLWFSAVDANTADVNGGTLELAFSGVVLDTAPVASVVAGQVTAGLVVRNGGALVLNGTDGSGSSTRLQLRGGMLVDGSTVSLGSRTTLELSAVGESERLALNDATVNLQDDAAFISEIATFGGASTVTTAAPLLQSASAGFRSAVLLQDAASVVNIRGAGDFYAESLLSLAGGALNVDMDPNTGKVITTGVVQGPGDINVNGGSFLESQGELNMRGAGVVDRISINNDGIIRVTSGGKLIGAGAITGSGTVDVESVGVLDANSGSLGVMMSGQLLKLSFYAELRLGLDPSAATTSTLEVDALLLDTPASGLAPTLNVIVDNDAPLPAGHKFVLVDYASIASGSSLAAHFRGLPDGFVFQAGLNQYQIRYSDPVYGAANGGNDSVITLTVVGREVVDDYYTVVENGALNVAAPGVLANDPVFINSGAGVAIVSTQPAHGIVVMGADGAFAYAPSAGFVGADSFEYVVFNGTVMSAPAVVHIDVTAQTSVLALIDGLIADVDDLCAAGELNWGLCNSLRVKLQHARSMFLSGNYAVADKSMAAFENEVSALRSGGLLTTAQAAPLLFVADAIRATL